MDATYSRHCAYKWQCNRREGNERFRPKPRFPRPNFFSPPHGHPCNFCARYSTLYRKNVPPPLLSPLGRHLLHLFSSRTPSSSRGPPWAFRFAYPRREGGPMASKRNRNGANLLSSSRSRAKKCGRARIAALPVSRQGHDCRCRLSVLDERELRVNSAENDPPLFTPFF